MSPLLARSLGLAIVLVGLSAVVGAVIVADQGSHSVSDKLISASPATLLILVASGVSLLLLERRVRADRLPP